MSKKTTKSQRELIDILMIMHNAVLSETSPEEMARQYKEKLAKTRGRELEWGDHLLDKEEE